jgi:hypothetical protein
MNHYKDSQIGAVDLGKRINPVDRGTLVANSLSTDLFRNREISTSHFHFGGFLGPSSPTHPL